MFLRFLVVLFINKRSTLKIYRFLSCDILRCVDHRKFDIVIYGWWSSCLAACQNPFLVEGWFMSFFLKVINLIFQCTRGVSVHSWLGRQLIALKSVSTTGTAAVHPSAATTAVAIHASSRYLTTCRHQLLTLTIRVVSIIESLQITLNVICLWNRYK